MKHADTVAARELTVFITNTSVIYHNHTIPTVERLAARLVNGSYDSTKAVKAWLHIADIGAQQYIKEFCAAGEKWHEIFTRPTRLVCAEELAEYYQEHMDEIAERIRTDKKNREVWTLAAIRQANDRVGYFFSRDTMKFFGDTMRSFSVACHDGKIFIVRVKPMRDRSGRNMGGLGDRRVFDPETGQISSVIREEESSK